MTLDRRGFLKVVPIFLAALWKALRSGNARNDVVRRQAAPETAGMAIPLEIPLEIGGVQPQGPPQQAPRRVFLPMVEINHDG